MNISKIINKHQRDLYDLEIRKVGLESGPRLDQIQEDIEDLRGTIFDLQELKENAETERRGFIAGMRFMADKELPSTLGRCFGEKMRKHLTYKLDVTYNGERGAFFWKGLDEDHKRKNSGALHGLGGDERLELNPAYLR